MDANGIKVFFFPDQILIWQSGKYGRCTLNGGQELDLKK
jgi:hypothetical protein